MLLFSSSNIMEFAFELASPVTILDNILLSDKVACIDPEPDIVLAMYSKRVGFVVCEPPPDILPDKYSHSVILEVSEPPPEIEEIIISFRELFAVCTPPPEIEEDVGTVVPTVVRLTDSLDEAITDDSKLTNSVRLAIDEPPPLIELVII